MANGMVAAVLREGVQNPNELLPPQVRRKKHRVAIGEDPRRLHRRPRKRHHRRLKGRMRVVKPLSDLHEDPGERA